MRRHSDCTTIEKPFRTSVCLTYALHLSNELDLDFRLSTMNLPLPLMSTLIPILIVIGAVSHLFSTHDVDQEVGVIAALGLVGAFGAVVSMLIPSHSRRQKAIDFGLFFGLCLLVGGFARLNAEVFNPYLESYQNDSDATTLFELSAFHGYLSFDELGFLTDTGGAIRVWSALYGLIESFGFGVSPSVGVLMNAGVVSVACVVAISAAEKLFGHTDRRVAVVRYLLATSGLVLMFGGLHLRDSFLLLFNSLILFLICSWRADVSALSMLRIVIGGFALVIVMTFFRRESIFIFYGLLGAILVERLVASRSKLRIIGFIIFAVAVLIAVDYLFDYYSELIDHTQKIYSDELNTEGSLGYKLIYSAPIPIRIVVGFFYMIAASVPVWAGFLFGEWYYWFVGIQAVQSLVVLPLFLISLRMISSGAAATDVLLPRLRIIALVYLMMGVVVSLSTLGLRHLGQFLPFLYILAAHGTSHRDVRLLTLIAGSVLLSMSFLWTIAKFA